MVKKFCKKLKHTAGDYMLKDKRKFFSYNLNNKNRIHLKNYKNFKYSKINFSIILPF